MSKFGRRILDYGDYSMNGCRPVFYQVNYGAFFGIEYMKESPYALFLKKLLC